MINLNWLKKSFLFCTLGSLLSCLSQRDLSEEQALIQPHVVPQSGPWFEGWYLRITPTNVNHGSIGAIIGSYLPPKPQNSIDKSLMGYAAILNGGQKNQALRAIEFFPKKVKMFMNKNDAVISEPRPGGSEAFRWVGEDAGELTENGLALSFPSGDRLQINWADISPWSPSGLGPEGTLSLIKLIPLHWYVHSLKSLAKFRLEEKKSDGKVQVTEGQGYLHLEKNWGRSFPDSYVWAQGIDLKTNTVLALAGGRPFQAGLIRPEVWILGYRSPNHKINFRTQDPGTMIESKVDGCRGQFELSAANLKHRIKISANAAKGSFGQISIPKENGFVPNGSEQSFQTEISIELFKKEIDFSNHRDDALKAIEKTIIKNGALEFGGKFKC